MSLDPNSVELDDDQTLMVDASRGVEVRVILNAPATVGTPTVHYYTLDGDDEWALATADTRPLDAQDALAVAQNGANDTRFKFSIPSTARMVEGTQDVLFVATIDGEKAHRYATLTLVGGGSLSGENPTPAAPDQPEPSPLPVIPAPPDSNEDPPTGDVKITTATPGALCVNGGTWLPASDFAIPMDLEGLTKDDGAVTVSYQYRTKRNTGKGSLTTATEAATYVSGGASLSHWQFSIPAGTNRLFEPNSTVTFTLRATRSDGSNATELRNVVVTTC
jgi:hypothetical protein